MNDPVAKPSRASDCDAELAQARADYAKLQAESKARTENLESEIREWKSRAHELGAVWSKATRWKRALVFCGAAPLDWAMGILLILTELLARGLCRLSRVPAPQFAVTDFRHCSIVIVTWRGKDLLTESLPPLMRALRRHGAAHQVIVVDNASADGTQEYLTEQFPNIKVISSHRNEFYGGGNNLGVQEAQNGIVVLLNNDMIVDEDFLEPLLAAFRDPDVFAVASQVFLGDALKARQETGKTRARFNGCELDWGHDPISSGDEQRGYVPVFWGHGGAVAVNRQKFLWLGGFDRLYDPFYVEDADLSYRAWKVGWRCVLAVHSRVIHKHRSSTSRFGAQFVNQIVRRNHTVFLYKNFNDIGLLTRHFLRAYRARIQQAGVPGVGIRLELRAWLGAAKRLPAIIARRLAMARSIVRSDREILESTDPQTDQPVAPG